MRGKMKILMILFLLAVVNCLISSEESNFLKRGKTRYIFTSPKALIAGRNETICFSMHDAILPFQVSVDLKIRDKVHSVKHRMTSDNECFYMAVPKLRTYVKVGQVAHFHIQFEHNGKVHTGHTNEPVVIYPNNNVIFIETDKNVYKPKDKVRIRILVLTSDLRTPQQYTIPLIKIINPNGITVTVWENIPTELGLVQIEHQLSVDTTKGKWLIELLETSQIFEVNDYVLPRFSVMLEAPKSVYLGMNSIKFTICGKYFYQQNVKGIAMIRVNLNSNHQPINKAKQVRFLVSLNYITLLFQLQNGCAKIAFTNEELNLKQHINGELAITGTITERGTDRAETTIFKISTTNKPYNLKFVDTDKYFQPGLPYHGQIKAIDSLIPLHTEAVEICYNVAVDRIWNIIEIKQCSNFSFGQSDTIHFHVFPVKDNVIQIRLYVRKSYPESLTKEIITYFTLNRWYSPTNSYLKLEQSNHLPAKCDTYQQFTVYYSTGKLRYRENITFYYMIKSRNNIYKMQAIKDILPKQRLINFKELTNAVGTTHRYVKKESSAGKLKLTFKLDVRIITKYEIIVYYILKNGEVVAANLDVPIESCLLNKVETSWSSAQYNPGDKASFIIKTSPKSLCAISSIDKAVKAVNLKEHLSADLLLKSVEKSTKRSIKFNCLSKAQKKSTDASVNTTDGVSRRRIKRHYGMNTPNQYDTLEAFNNFGVVTITNMKLLTKACIQEGDFAVLESYYNVHADNYGSYIRTFFPETWLWELVPIASFETRVSRDLPHTITSWVTTTLCVSSSLGVGLSLPTEVTVFQPFFLDVVTPFSIKQYEDLHLQIVVYNYLNFSVPVRTTLGFSDGLILIDNPDDRSEVSCMPALDSKTIIYRLEGTKFGKTSVHVLAEIDSSYPEECGPDVILHRRDMVVKEILVEPEGHPVIITKSILLCTNETTHMNKANWTLDPPNDIIEDTGRAKLILNGDLLGPTIMNLEKLLIVPTGCGEQIMAILAPNLYVLKYLKAIGTLTPSMQQRAMRNLKIGYQRILDYVHNDGSFSAFGYHDQTGSMFLTAFVVKVLQMSKQHIYVDQNVINNAVRWIINNQLENGCFATLSHVFHDMGGTHMENSTAALTSYVMISLIESGIEITEKVRTNAKYCIRGHFSPDKYTLSISTYALSLIGWESEAKRCLYKLLKVATQHNSLMWWSSSGPASTNVEMTGYVLMSLVHQNSTDNLINANSVVRWLSSQRGPQGGFISTQDTVVALDAITKYALFTQSAATDLHVNLTVGKKEYQMSINANDRLKTKEQNIKQLPNDVFILIEGKGCVLIQSLLEYNMHQPTNSEAFKLAVEVDPISNIDECAIAIISTCVSYLGPGLHSNMAILEITMPSGYEPDRASLYKLVQENTSRVKKFEENDNQVILYFTEIDEEPVCVPFYINEYNKVDPRVDANVKLYDYYNPDLQVSTHVVEDRINISYVTDMNKTSDGAKEQTESRVMENIIKTELPMKKNYKLNPDFVDWDVDMAVPNGEEGNMPVYVKPDALHTNIKNNNHK
ncbi:hypothetical protein FQA39_LY10731 [Lamprigera yunnana]|nr:hypothetical protein FQA39_LY10731 [Lamprigera yunnana]